MTSYDISIEGKNSYVLDEDVSKAYFYQLRDHLLPKDEKNDGYDQKSDNEPFECDGYRFVANFQNHFIEGYRVHDILFIGYEIPGADQKIFCSNSRSKRHSFYFANTKSLNMDSEGLPKLYFFDNHCPPSPEITDKIRNLYESMLDIVMTIFNEKEVTDEQKNTFEEKLKPVLDLRARDLYVVDKETSAGLFDAVFEELMRVPDTGDMASYSFNIDYLSCGISAKAVIDPDTGTKELVFTYSDNVHPGETRYVYAYDPVKQTGDHKVIVSEEGKDSEELLFSEYYESFAGFYNSLLDVFNTKLVKEEEVSEKQGRTVREHKGRIDYSSRKNRRSKGC